MRDDGTVLQSLLDWKCPQSSSSSSGDMTLPVSSYEELLARVRSLTNETIQLRELTATPLLDHNDNERYVNSVGCDNTKRVTGISPYSSWNTRHQDSHIVDTENCSSPLWQPPHHNVTKRDTRLQRDVATTVENGTEDLMTASLLAHIRSNARFGNKEYVMDEPKEEDEKTASEGVRMMSSATQTRHGSEPGLTTLYHGSWPVENALWHSGPSAVGRQDQDVPSVMSFSSSMDSRRSFGNQQLGAKVEMVYNLLSMLGTHDKEDMGKTLLAMSSSPESCLAMRQSGCLPLLVQLLHSPERDTETRRRASRALQNIVEANPDEKRGRREGRVLRLLEQIRKYCDELRQPLNASSPGSDEIERHPGPTIAALMKLSFDEEHRHAMCQLGALHAIAELLEVDHEAHESRTGDQYCITLRRYAGMALTNLTFGDSANKALLCSLQPFMSALVAQLDSPSEDLRQVTASVLRNLSWQADAPSKQRLREVGAVMALMRAAMEAKKESTLKSILSALWNLSAHCSLNKVDICAVDGAVEFLVEMLSYKAPSKTMAIIENAGGILRNVSSHVAVREDLRSILREHNCLPVLLAQLRSPSLTVVSNACGTLWNLSARCPTDQQMLWNLGAVGMLRSLVHSKHRMISMGSSAALKNLLAARPNCPLPSTTPGALPGLAVRKRRALEQELDQTLAETCENIEPASSPPRRSDSRDSVTSTLSDSVYERVARTYGIMQKSSPGTLTGSSSDSEKMHHQIPASSERRFLQRYYSSMKEKDEERGLTSLDHSNEDNTLERDGKMTDLNYQTSHSRLSHIEESERRQVLPGTAYATSRPTYLPRSGYCQPGSSAAYPSLRTCYPSSYDDDASQEQPIDYSLKYVEPNVERHTSATVIHDSEVRLVKTSTTQNDLGRGYMNSGSSHLSVASSKNVKTNVSYGDYAETDLDQPTDYSLQYAEEDEDECNLEKNENLQVDDERHLLDTSDPLHEDTLKTYCTEGTPYETPYNYSVATSMTDLRKSDLTDDEKKDDILPNNDKTTEGAVSNLITEVIEDKPSSSVKQVVSGFSSGLLSPEKPVQYCEEGTPGYFSRVSSLSSLNSAPCHTAVHKPSSDTDEKKDFHQNLSTFVKEDQKPDKEGKAVTFSKTDHYAEETPLMFSRCSSLGSLSSFEQHSIHDDRSSVVSDFSRRTSGMISPSELPDSPTQTVPSSPPHGKSSVDFLNDKPTSQQPAANKSVFEDEVTAFKEENTPVEFSTTTSLSSLNIDDDPKELTSDPVLKEKDEGMEKQDTEKEKKELSELAPVSEGDEDDDEDMLAACITMGMQNSGSRQRQTNPATPTSSPRRASGIPVKVPPTSRLPRAVLPTTNNKVCSYIQGACEDTLRTYHTEDTPANISHAGSHSDLSALSAEETDSPKLGGVQELSDDSSNLSGDNENILAECIQSGMPKPRPHPVKRSTVTPASKRPPSRRPPSHHLCGLDHGPRRSPVRVKPSCLPAKDEMQTYATEDTPKIFSNRSSLSDLVKASEGDTDTNKEVCEPLSDYDHPVRFTNEEQQDSIRATSVSSLGHVVQDDVGDLCRTMDNMVLSSDGSWCLQNRTSSTSEDPVTVLSRNASLSSLSVDSFGSAEPTPSEQALLEQCITSGMPKGKSGLLLKKSERSKTCCQEGTHHIQYSSKNGIKSSAAEPVMKEEAEKAVTNAADVERRDMVLQDLKCQKTEEMIQIDGKIEDKNSAVLNENSPLSCEDSPLDYSNRDGDVMLVSLDKMTEDLLLLSKKNSDSNVMKQSDTWNEDSSPNDISFPTMSVSAPTVGSFKSDIRDDLLPELVEEDMASRGSLSLTDSHMLETEANKVVGAVQDEPCSLDHSMNSVDLDAIKPPSMMGSLVSLTSLSGNQENGDALSAPAHLSRNGSRHSRKKSLPPGMMVRRALGVNNSIENLLENVSISSSYNSQLDNVKPPSAMDEVVDLENSMVSVASITSEVADTSNKEHSHSDLGSDAAFDLMKPAASTMAQVYMAQHGGTSNSASDCLDNIDPPSAFDDITEAAVIGGEIIDSDTELCIEDQHENVDTPDLPSDNKTTPVISSADSTPKRSPLRSRLTPKEKRQMSKQRYMTYTIESELDEQDITAVAAENHLLEESNSSPEINSNTFKITPKQRRQENRNRFQTRVLDKESVPNINVESLSNRVNEDNDVDEASAPDPDTSPLCSPRSRIFKQKRKEVKERFLTRTLSEEEKSGAKVSDPLTSENFTSAVPEIENLLENEAKKIISNLNANRRLSSESSDPRSEDLMLDCETLSLISVESESEHEDEGIPTYHFEINSGKAEEISSDESELEDEKGKSLSPNLLKPRIVKPDQENEGIADVNDVENNEVQDAPKPIRGRRKLLYSSYSARSSPAGQRLGRGRGGIPVTTVKRPASSSPVAKQPVSKIPSLGNTTSRNISPKFQQQRNLKLKSSLGKPKVNVLKTPSRGKENSGYTNIPSNNTADVDARFKPPERQGTFTKDEPTTPNIAKMFPPVPNSPTRATRIPVPASVFDKADTAKKKTLMTPKAVPSATNKPKLRREISQPTTRSATHNRLNKALSQDCTAAIKSLDKATSRNATPRSAHAKLAYRKSVCGSEMKTSLSNQSLKSNDGVKSSPKYSAGDGLQQRSTSNCSLNSVTSTGKRSAKKEVASKIAGIWKRTDAKSKSGTATPRKEDSSNASGRKLVRSSTFEGLDKKLSSHTQTDSGNKVQKRIAEVHPSTREGQNEEVIRRPRSEGDDKTKRLSRLGSFIRVESSETDNKKAPPASAVVQPFNYSPPSGVDMPVTNGITKDADTDEDSSIQKLS